MASRMPHHSSRLLNAVLGVRRGSPLSQKVTLRMLQRAKDRPLSVCLQMDFRIVSRMVCGPSDFWEGVRATLIDKDRKPSWLETDLTKARCCECCTVSECPSTRTDECKVASDR